jgi:hypothetical protein
METEIIILFCIVDDYLKILNFKDDLQATMPSTEVMTVTIAAAMFFGGNHQRSQDFFKDHKYVRYMLSKSQFNRRMHSIPMHIWEDLQRILSEVFKQENETKEYVVDSFPVAVCHNIRISRCKIYKGEEYRGFSASKRQYFYGIRVHMIATTDRKPVEIIFYPGAASDAKIYKFFDLDLPEGSTVYGDALYMDYEFEEQVKYDANINLLNSRKSNSKRPHMPYLSFLIQHGRKKIETTFSCITSLFPKTIHAVTSRGFELKILCFILGYSFSRL